jgi:DNA-binding NarL/FixJ family response regulator
MSTPHLHQIWLVEDNATFRRTIIRVLESQPDFSCPEGYAKSEQALAALDRGLKPEIILLDVGLPGMSGLDALPLLRAKAPDAKILILTVFDDDDKIFRAICAGAAGYLLKTSPPEEICSAIREVLDGGAPMNSRIAARVLAMFSKFGQPSKDYHLTERETEILELMTEGRLKKEIADQLGLSVHTVDSHLRKIYVKLEVNTRSEAVAKALKEKLV